MGRSHRPAEWSEGRPSGPKWVAFRRVLVRQWYSAGRTCYYCGAHGFLSPDHIEVAHLISPIVAPGKGWSLDNLVPAHGSRGRRCPEPGCGLACNYLAAIAPDMVKNADGEDMPFTAQFLERQKATREGAQFPGKNGRSNGKPSVPGGSPRKSRDVPAALEHGSESVGRVW